jgi:hypothetical protein
MAGMDALWGGLGLGLLIFLSYAGHVLYLWGKHRWPEKSC